MLLQITMLLHIAVLLQVAEAEVDVHVALM